MAEQAEKILIECVDSNRKGVGDIIFKQMDGYQYPVAEFPADQAKKLVTADERAHDNAVARNALRSAEYKKEYDTITQLHFRYAVKIDAPVKNDEAVAPEETPAPKTPAPEETPGPETPAHRGRKAKD